MVATSSLRVIKAPRKAPRREEPSAKPKLKLIAPIAPALRSGQAPLIAAISERATKVLKRPPETIEEAIYHGAGVHYLEGARSYYEAMGRQAHANMKSPHPVEGFLVKFVPEYMTRYKKFLEKQKEREKRGG